MFCLIFFLYGKLLRPLLLFSPGYIVTIGYIIRACYLPSLELRRVIWGASALVQGAWFSWFAVGDFSHGMHGFAFEWISLLWWAFAFLASIYGLVADA